MLNTLDAARVHVFGLRPDDSSAVGSSVKALDAWFASVGRKVTFNTPAREHDIVVDVVVLGPEQWFVGWHVHRATQYGGLGGVEAITVDEGSPSRAYSKVAELLCLGELTLRPGNTVVELGAAPGGATMFFTAWRPRVGRGSRAIGRAGRGVGASSRQLARGASNDGGGSDGRATPKTRGLPGFGCKLGAICFLALLGKAVRNAQRAKKSAIGQLQDQRIKSRGNDPWGAHQSAGLGSTVWVVANARGSTAESST